MSAPKRADAALAVAGLFARNTATGGLAGRNDKDPTAPVGVRQANATEEARLRLSVELTEEEIGFLRALSRPGRTGQPRTLGSKFVATGVLAAAIELLSASDVDMHGVEARGQAAAARRRELTGLRHRVEAEHLDGL